MLYIDKDILIKRAGFYSNYLKGKKYYSEGRVIGLSSNNGFDYFKSIVRGAINYEVAIRFDKHGYIVSTSCTCPTYNKYIGDCKHIVATLECIRNLELSGKLRKKYEFNLDESHSIEKSSFLNLRIGEDRLYVVRNIKNY